MRHRFAFAVCALLLCVAGTALAADLSGYVGEWRGDIQVDGRAEQIPLRLVIERTGITQYYREWGETWRPSQAAIQRYENAGANLVYYWIATDSSGTETQVFSLSRIDESTLGLRWIRHGNTRQSVSGGNEWSMTGSARLVRTSVPQPPKPAADLFITGLEATRPADYSARTFSFCRFTVTNNGPVDLYDEGLMVDYILSSDRSIGNADDHKIGDTGITVSIRARASETITLSATGLGNMVREWQMGLVPSGSYYLFATLRFQDSEPVDPVPGNNTAISFDAFSYAASYYPPQPPLPPTPRPGSVLDMLFVPGGSFRMGSTRGGRDNDEKPAHRLTMSGFLMARMEVTQEQYRLVTGSSPSSFRGDGLPVENISWFDAVEFCNLLSEREGLQKVYTISRRTPGAGYPVKDAVVSTDFSKNGYRLPTEAEWEYAAKGGNGSPGDFVYAGSDDVDEVAWYADTSGDKPQPVGRKRANALGFFDMSGNVWEWCQDWYDSEYYTKSPASDPAGPASGRKRSVRGGSWTSEGDSCRTTYRMNDEPGNRDSLTGLRPVRRP